MENTLKFNSSLVEMTQTELIETEGGIHPALVVLACGGALALGIGIGIGACYLAYRYL
jgi:lactobin A/cerein 7B family class IIb bacteriocin